MSRFSQFLAALLLLVSYGVDAEMTVSSRQDEADQEVRRLLPRSLLEGARSLGGSYAQKAKGGYAPLAVKAAVGYSPAVSGGYAPSYGSYGYASYGSNNKSAKKNKKSKKDKKSSKTKKSKKSKKGKKGKKGKKEKKEKNGAKP